MPTIFYLFLAFLLIFTYIIRKRQKLNSIGFFHPFCNAGGGGERVLWCAIRSMQKNYPDYTFHVYSGDIDATKEQILLKARQRFGIEVNPSKVHFVPLYLRRLVEADLYPRFTMLMQAIMGGVLALEAIIRFTPSVFIDTMGYPLSLPVFRLFGGCKVAAYVHYPTISCDMLEVVQSRQSTFNNSDIIAQSHFLSILKLLYYRLFAICYCLAGKTANIVMVNGKWTMSHIKSIWSRSDVNIVYPPCDVDNFLTIDSTAEALFDKTKQVRILSIGQIRPEKNHQLQLEVVKEVKDRLASRGMSVKLCIAGGCRNRGDEQRVEHLKRMAKKLGIEENIEWHLNIMYEDLLDELSKALVSIHTMHNEHFGISVVEAMAAATVVLSNDSGGPQMDIVKEHDGKTVGYLSITKQEYAESIMRIIEEGREKRDEIRENARKSLDRFNEKSFEHRWNQEMKKLIHA